jgi:hypothetical protein
MVRKASNDAEVTQYNIDNAGITVHSVTRVLGRECVVDFS